MKGILENKSATSRKDVMSKEQYWHHMIESRRLIKTQKPYINAIRHKDTKTLTLALIHKGARLNLIPLIEKSIIELTLG